MNYRKLALSLLLATAASAQAHTHLESSAPANQSRVPAPTAIELQFSEAAKLTALSLQKGAEAAKPLQPLPAAAGKKLSVPAPALAAGDYVVNWRVLSNDGHVMSGKFSFTVDPAAPAAKPAAAATPDHHHH